MPRVDAHAHVFLRDLPIAPGARHRPDADASIESYLQILDTVGVTHALLSAPSFLGANTSYLETALRRDPARLRGTAILAPQTPRAEVRRLDALGFVGVRFNLFGVTALPDLASRDYRDLLTSAADLGWHAEIYADAAALATLLPPLMNRGVVAVVDHFGSPDNIHGVDDPGFKTLLRAMESGAAWTKLSAPYRVPAVDKPAVARALLEAGGAGQLLWGSDWPWTQHADGKTYADTLAWLDTWAPASTDRDQILGANPMKLFRFDSSPTPPAIPAVAQC